MKVSYSSLIEKVILSMITAPRRVYTGRQIKDVIRSCTTEVELTENQLTVCLNKLKTDKRIETSRVSSKKVYYKYKGVF